MADGSVLLGGYKVGLISASLNSKSDEKRNDKEESVNTLLFTSDIQQPSFVPITRKKLRKDPSLTENERRKAEQTDEEERKGTKRKHSMNDDADIKKRKIGKLSSNKSANDDPERLARTIFVGNLPITTSRKELKIFFKKYGAIESTRLRSVAVPDLKTSKKLAIIKKHFNPNRNNLNGYVVFKDKESVEKALESNGRVIGGLHIRVDRADRDGKQYDHKRSIFVGNLMFDIKEEALSDHFAVCGQVESVRIIRDSVTGIGKGFGYVLFEETSSVSLALKMNHTELCGRKIRVQRSQEKPKLLKGGVTKNGRGDDKFSGMQAKEKFYHKRKAMKQQRKCGLVNAKKNPSKVTTKHSKRTSNKPNKKSKRF